MEIPLGGAKTQRQTILARPYLAFAAGLAGPVIGFSPRIATGPAGLISSGLSSLYSGKYAVVNFQGQRGKAGHHDPAAGRTPGVAYSAYPDPNFPRHILREPGFRPESCTSLRFQVSQSLSAMLCMTCVA